MQGRGEFSFLIADTAKMEKVLDQHWHSGCIWAVFLASFVAPFGFRYVLGVEKKKMVAGKGGGGSSRRRRNLVCAIAVEIAPVQRAARRAATKQQVGEIVNL